MLEDSTAFILKGLFFQSILCYSSFTVLAVLNDYNEFVGILTHSNIFDVIEDSFWYADGWLYINNCNTRL